jgi:mono/diheme cytochrome c family protein
MRGWIFGLCLTALAGSAFADSGSGEQFAFHFGAPHHGNRHEQHHGMGREGQGLCPQNRTVPATPEELRKKKNPLPAKSAHLNAGESLFHVQAEPTACKICHGASGNGMGMMAQGQGAMPRNFQCADTMKAISDGQLFYVIRNGSGGTGMPAFKNLSDTQIWQLILYVRSLGGRTK